MKPKQKQKQRARKKKRERRTKEANRRIETANERKIVRKKRKEKNQIKTSTSSHPPSPSLVKIWRKHLLPSKVHLVAKIIPVPPRVAAEAQALEGWRWRRRASGASSSFLLGGGALFAAAAAAAFGRRRRGRRRNRRSKALQERRGSCSIRSQARQRRQRLGTGFDEGAVDFFKAAAVEVEPHELFRPGEKPRDELAGARAAAGR